MAIQFRKATKSTARARIALAGPSGSGKTFTALRIAAGLGRSVAVIDTEYGSASKYADMFDFSVVELSVFAPKNYIEALDVAQSAGFDVVIIDSLSHAWMGKGGVLEIVDKAGQRARGNTYAGWREGTPAQQSLVEAILACRAHVIATMRSKTEYVLEKGRNGKMAPRKVGMAPVQRDGVEYEFDIVGELDERHNLIITKTRCNDLDGEVFALPGEEVGRRIAAWLSDGATPAPRLEVVQPAKEVEEKPEEKPREKPIDVKAICGRRSEVLLTVDWVPEDLTDYIVAWTQECKNFEAVVRTLIPAAMKRCGLSWDAVTKELLGRAKHPRFGDMATEALAAAWCDLVCPEPVEIEVPSDETDALYTVALKDGKALRCSCPAGVHKKTCKHLTRAEAVMRGNAELEALPGVGKALVTKLLAAGYTSTQDVHADTIGDPEKIERLLGAKAYDLLVHHFTGAPRTCLERVRGFVDDAQAKGLRDEELQGYVHAQVAESVARMRGCAIEDAVALIEGQAGEVLYELNNGAIASAWEAVAKGAQA